MSISGDPLLLAKGANVGLRDLDDELGSVSVVLETGSSGGQAVDADVSVFLLGAEDKARSSEDFVFYNQPIGSSGAVRLRDKIRSEDDDNPISMDTVTIELDSVPDDVRRIVLCASLDPSVEATFGDASFARMVLRRAADALELLSFRIDDATTETALVFGEFYRRHEQWRVRAVGQGYSGGLAVLASEFGIDVAYDDVAAASVSSQGSGEPQSLTDTSPEALDSDTVDTGGSDASADSGHVSADESTEPAVATRPVSVRRPVRAPKMPEAWDATVPANDDEDWQKARLFPVAGIGGRQEQEGRATSALLAVMATVKDFGRALTARLGAPAGRLETFVEVPFGHGEQVLRPDGVLRISWGARVWTALVEVKTGDSKLELAQVDSYVDIARAKGFDAVITISNQLVGAGMDHPLPIDRRKLKRVALQHLSWDQVRTSAVLLAEHRGLGDTTQQAVLVEFLRYVRHARSGMHGFTDMGDQWVTVRDAVRAKTLRALDRSAISVTDQFDQLVSHLALHLTGLLGVEVQPATLRVAPDSTSRCQQLADSGVLFGSLRVPGAISPVVLSADLRAEKVGCSVTFDAPRDGRPSTKINWLLRQIPAARDAVRIEALLAGGRGHSTVQLLGALRKNPEALIPLDSREIKSFRVSLDVPMGSKRGTGQGSLIGSLVSVTDLFYAEVVQNIAPWVARALRAPVTGNTAT